MFLPAPDSTWRCAKSIAKALQGAGGAGLRALLAPGVTPRGALRLATKQCLRQLKLRWWKHVVIQHALGHFPGSVRNAAYSSGFQARPEVPNG